MMEEKMKTSPIFHFERGIYGFEDIKEFTILKASEDGDNPIHIMMPRDRSDIRFILIPPVYADSGYEMDLEDGDVKSLGIERPEDVMVFSIVSVAGDKSMTANLKSPIVLSIRTMKGKQIILEKSDYSIRHPLKTRNKG